MLGYTATVAVSEDHSVVAQQVSQVPSDHDLLVPMVGAVQEQCGEPPQQASADSGFFRLQNVRALEAQGIDVYMPDSTLARELNTGRRAKRGAAAPVRDPVHRRLRAKLRSPGGRAIYQRRKAIVESVVGVLKQRGMRQFRRRGLAKVSVEFTLAAIAYNLTRIRAVQRWCSTTTTGPSSWHSRFLETRASLWHKKEVATQALKSRRDRHLP